MFESDLQISELMGRCLSVIADGVVVMSKPVTGSPVSMKFDRYGNVFSVSASPSPVQLVTWEGDGVASRQIPVPSGRLFVGMAYLPTNYARLIFYFPGDSSAIYHYQSTFQFFAVDSSGDFLTVPAWPLNSSGHIYKGVVL